MSLSYDEKSHASVHFRSFYNSLNILNGEPLPSGTVCVKINPIRDSMSASLVADSSIQSPPPPIPQFNGRDLPSKGTPVAGRDVAVVTADSLDPLKSATSVRELAKVFNKNLSPLVAPVLPQSVDTRPLTASPSVSGARDSSTTRLSTAPTTPSVSPISSAFDVPERVPSVSVLNAQTSELVASVVLTVIASPIKPSGPTVAVGVSRTASDSVSDSGAARTSPSVSVSHLADAASPPVLAVGVPALSVTLQTASAAVTTSGSVAATTPVANTGKDVLDSLSPLSDDATSPVGAISATGSDASTKPAAGTSKGAQNSSPAAAGKPQQQPLEATASRPILTVTTTTAISTTGRSTHNAQPPVLTGAAKEEQVRPPAVLELPSAFSPEQPELVGMSPSVAAESTQGLKQPEQSLADAAASVSTPPVIPPPAASWPLWKKIILAIGIASAVVGVIAIAAHFSAKVKGFFKNVWS